MRLVAPRLQVVLKSLLLVLILSDAYAGDADDGEPLVRVVAPVVPAGAMDFQEGRSVEHHYQPTFFDPAIHAVPTPPAAEPNRSPVRFAVAPPYEVAVYTFSMASSSDYVVEIREETNRHMLLTHVDRHVGPDSVSANGRSLLVSNNLRTADGRWQHVLRVIDIPTQTKTRLPHMDCTQRGWRWDGERVLTWGLTLDRGGPARGLNTPVCLWNAGGRLLHRVVAGACWHAGAGDYMESALGLLPDHDDVLWLYNGDCQSLRDPDATCQIHLQELTGQRRHRTVLLGAGPPRDGCPAADRISFDMTGATFERPIFRYRVDPDEGEDATWQSVGVQ